MNKRIFSAVIMFCIVSIQVFSDSDKPFFYISDTSRGLYETGKVYENKFYILFGEHQNTAISPNVFNTIGIGQDIGNLEPVKKIGTMELRSYYTVKLLVPASAFPDAQEPLTIDFFLRGGFNVQYPITVPVGPDRFDLKISPYLRAEAILGLFPQIYNISVQSFFTLNSGAEVAAQYSLTDEIRLGADISTFLIGMDTGRDGYNKDYIPDIVFSHPGNYIDLNLELFGEFDFSRTESLRIGYAHNVNSYYGGTYSMISGDHRIGVSVLRKLIR